MSPEQIAALIRKFRQQVLEGMRLANRPGCIDYGEYLDSKYWKPYEPDPGDKVHFVWHLQPGAKPSEAVRAIFRDGANSRMECLSVMSAIYYRALLETLGADKFDRIFAGGNKLVIAQRSPVHWLLTGKAPGAPLEAGDWVYIKGHKDYDADIFNKSLGRSWGAWRGENSVCNGNGTFSGLGLENLTEQEMRQELLGGYNQKVTAYNRTPQGQAHPLPPGDPKDVVGLLQRSIQAPDPDKIAALAQL